MDSEIIKSLEAFDNRTIYKQLSPEVIAQIPDDQLEQAIIDYVGTKIGDDYQRQREIVSKLAPGIRALYVTWWVEAEVNNGGFNQYYWNSAGEFADDAPAAFEFFGANDHAALMREANRLHSAEAAVIAKYKARNTIEAFSESYKQSKLNSLDDRFYALTENLSSLRISRIRAAPTDFVGD